MLKGRYRWKDDPESALYDYKRIERMLADIRQLIDAKDVLGIMSYMRYGDLLAALSALSLNRVGWPAGRACSGTLPAPATSACSPTCAPARNG